MNEAPADDGRAEQGEADAERELKFIVVKETLKAALSAPFLGGGDGLPVWKDLRSVYFDDDDGDLSRARVALRVRSVDGGFVMSLKRAAPGDRGAFERQETEVASPSGEPDLSLFDEGAKRALTELTGAKPLAPRFGSEIRRAVRTIEKDGAAIEVAFDDGFLFAGDAREAAAEIELELKSGPPVALFDLGLELVEAFPVKLGVISKAERAHALIAAEPPEPVHAEAVDLSRGATLDEAIGAVIRGCLAHFLGNLPALEAGDKVEAVHQMRVAMRRLRSAMDLFDKAFPTPGLGALRAEAKRIGIVLGQARDWDVFVIALRSGSLQRFAREPGFNRLAEAASERAEAGHSTVARLLDDRTIARFALSLERLAAAREWRESAVKETLAALDEPVAAFAARALGRLDRRLRKRGRGFRSLTPPERHRLRIAIKHMRYATEFFGGLFDMKRAKRFTSRASDFQDTLGGLNDAANAMRLGSELASGLGAELARVSGVVTEWCARESEGDAEGLKREWRRMRKIAARWRDEYETQA
jgi:inorganic triphosphatase YgiF